MGSLIVYSESLHSQVDHARLYARYVVEPLAAFWKQRLNRKVISGEVRQDGTFRNKEGIESGGQSWPSGLVTLLSHTILNIMDTS